jgi:hypothetical protein
VITRLVALAGLMSLAAGCAARAEDPPRDPGTAIVQVRGGGGLAPAADRWRLPWVSVFGDGTMVVAAGDQGTLFTGVRRSLTPAEITTLFDRAGGADLFADEEYRRDDILDAGYLSVRVTSTVRTYETTVIQPSDQDRGDRRAVLEFARWASGLGTPVGEYRPSRYAVLTGSGSGPDDDVRPWPLPVPPSDCALLDDSTAATMLTEARTAGDDTRWRAGDHLVRLHVRPLLPGEPDCAAVR